MTKRRKKGEVVAFSLRAVLLKALGGPGSDGYEDKCDIFGDPEDYAETEIRFKHVGINELRRWERLMGGFRLGEIQRVEALRETIPSDLYQKYMEDAQAGTPVTEEGNTALTEMVDEIIAGSFAGVRGWPDDEVNSWNVAEQYDELKRLSLLELLIDAAQEVQRPKASTFPAMPAARGSRRKKGQNSESSV